MLWRAEGYLVNDDGLTVEIEGNTNYYRMSASFKKSFGNNEITINFIKTLSSMNYPQEGDIKACKPVNKNDYLGNIIIYNVGDNGDNKDYAVIA